MARNMSAAKDLDSVGDQTHVLLVFSQAHVVRVIKAQLEHSGCQVSSIDNAESALSLIHAGHYAAVLVEADLPRMNGVQLCMNIQRQLQQNQPQLFLTGITTCELAEHQSDWPMPAQCMPWPINVEALLQALSQPPGVTDSAVKLPV